MGLKNRRIVCPVSDPMKKFLKSHDKKVIDEKVIEIWF
jgi:hypothetical protein